MGIFALGDAITVYFGFLLNLYVLFQIIHWIFIALEH